MSFIQKIRTSAQTFIKTGKVRVTLVIILLAATFFIWCVLLYTKQNVLTVAFLNIGQGDSIFIETPNGTQVLIDGGPDKKVLRELNKVMPFYDRSIDMVIATHPDKDHIGGLPDVFKRFHVTTFLEPGVSSDTGTYRALMQSAANEGAHHIVVNRRMSFALDNNVHLQILFPDRDASGLENNMASIVTRLVFGENEFLLTGDSPHAIEKYLVSLFGDALHSDVLKAGHHGSRTSSSDMFIEYVDPDYAIISAGAHNSYGHPHTEVIDALLSHGATIMETKNGTIIFKSDGKHLRLK